MSDKKFTLIELHLDGDTQFGPKTISDALPIGADGTDEEGEDVDTVDASSDRDEVAGVDEPDSGRNGAVGVILAILVLVGIAVVAKKYRGDDDSAIDEEEHPDVVVT